MAKYKVIIYQRKKQDKVRSTKSFALLKKAKHLAKVAYVSGYPVRIDKIISKKKVKRRKK